MCHKCNWVIIALFVNNILSPAATLIILKLYITRISIVLRNQEGYDMQEFHKQD